MGLRLHVVFAIAYCLSAQGLPQCSGCIHSIQFTGTPSRNMATTYAWCACPIVYKDSLQIFFHAGRFSEDEFVQYYVPLALGKLTSLPGADLSHCHIFSPEQFRTIFEPEQLWQCVQCKKMQPHMKKCQFCFIRCCSKKCSKLNWPLHKKVCADLHNFKDNKYLNRPQEYQAQLQAILRKGQGFQFLDEANYWRLRLLVDPGLDVAAEAAKVHVPGISRTLYLQTPGSSSSMDVFQGFPVDAPAMGPPGFADGPNMGPPGFADGL